MNRSVGRTAFLLAALAALVAGLFAWRVTMPPQVQQQELDKLGLFLFPAPRELPAFEMPSTGSDPVTGRDLVGAWTGLFFGFTYCPDVCPTTLADVSAAWRALPPPQQQQVRFWMVSVDPARDQVDHLRRYVEHFDPRMVGVTGTVPQLAEFARWFNAVFARVPGPAENYQVDHSAHLALVNPDGRFAGILRPPINADRIERALKLLIDHYPFEVVAARGS